MGQRLPRPGPSPGLDGERQSKRRKGENRPPQPRRDERRMGRGLRPVRHVSCPTTLTWLGAGREAVVIARRMSSRTARGVTLFLVVAAVACNEKALERGGSSDGGQGASSLLTPEQAAKVLARVGDRTITLGDYVAALEHMDQFDRLRYQSSERRKELLKEMIDIELLANEARAKGYDKDPLAEQQVRA